MVGVRKKKLKRDMTPQELYRNNKGGIIGPCRICVKDVYQTDSFVITGADIILCTPCYEKRISRNAAKI